MSIVNFTSQDDSSDLEWDPQCHSSEKDSEVMELNLLELS